MGFDQLDYLIMLFQQQRLYSIKCNYNMIKNYEQERIWKEAVMDYLKVPISILLERIRKSMIQGSW
jgi:hypothetical protein